MTDPDRIGKEQTVTLPLIVISNQERKDGLEGVFSYLGIPCAVTTACRRTGRRAGKWNTADRRGHAAARPRLGLGGKGHHHKAARWRRAQPWASARAGEGPHGGTAISPLVAMGGYLLLDAGLE